MDFKKCAAFWLLLKGMNGVTIITTRSTSIADGKAVLVSRTLRAWLISPKQIVRPLFVQRLFLQRLFVQGIFVQSI